MNEVLRSMPYDFANILFAGPCNARCPFCIGRQIDPRLSVNNLRDFPLRNLDRFMALIAEHAIKQIVLTGTTTDPQLYQHEARLLDRLRHELPGDTRYSLHTNGRLALQKMDVLNQYDRVCLSFPSFNAATYRQMMGVPGVPDLARIIDRAEIPVKVSCLINEHNRLELPDFLERCYELGLKRLVLRQEYGREQVWSVIPDFNWRDSYRGNPVYGYRDMKVTLWNFEQCDCAALNLFSDGTISTDYLLAKA